LSEVGFVEGRNIAIEYRWAENQYDRLPALGAGSSSPSGGGDCHARWKCGVTCCEAGDHHDSSRVLWQRRPGRMNRPGGNVTGVVTLNIDTGQKRLELGSTTARSGDEVALIADTISPLSTCGDRIFFKQFLAPAFKKKNAARPLGPKSWGSH